MSEDEVKKIMAQLAKPLPPEAIQRTKTAQTKKGYNTDGYGYQFCINRFNEILGDKWGYTYEIIDMQKGKYSSGGDKIDITVSCHIWILTNDSDHTRSCIGGHISKTYCDALKGAITNGFKKTAAWFGVGRHAYEGALENGGDPYLDDDNAASEDTDESRTDQQQKTNFPPPAQQQSAESKEKSNGNGKGKTITVQEIWTKFGKLKFPAEYKEAYKAYYLDKFKGAESMTHLNQEQMGFLETRLMTAVKDKEYLAEFKAHLNNFLPQKQTKQDANSINFLYTLFEQLNFPQDYINRWESFVCERYKLGGTEEISLNEMKKQEAIIRQALSSKNDAIKFMRTLEEYNIAGQQYPEHQPEDASSIN